MNSQQDPMSEQSITEQLRTAGARVRGRSGRNDHYGSPRDFSFEIKAVFDNGLGLQITARQYNYRDPWEMAGRVNDLVDVTLLHQGQFSELPKGFLWFQGRDTEEGLDSEQLEKIIETVRQINPKLFLLQNLTGDM